VRHTKIIMEDQYHKLYEEYLFPNKLRRLAGPTKVKKPENTSSNQFSFLCLAGSCETGKLLIDHWLIRFSNTRKLKRKYHINNIISLISSFSDFSIKITFNSLTSLKSSIKGLESETRTFFFEDLSSCREFSLQLQKSILNCNSKANVKTTIAGDLLPQENVNELNELRNKVIQRGERLNEALETSERLRNSAQTFSIKARQLRNSFE